jgi:glycosyltransferase involved in cell wall biosynthesis
MSVCAVMLVKDEADIIEHTIDWLCTQVDEIIVADNNSTDGTTELLADGIRTGKPVILLHDPELGYWQSRKTTALAREALQRGHTWVLPCDADELWYSPDGRTICQLLGGLAPDVQFVEAPLFNHLPTALDGSDPNPFRRIGWRQREHGVLPKVACRLRPDLIIHAGNHSASTSGTGATSGGLIVRHYSWRTPDQYVRKIRNGSLAYRATDLPETTGTHWRIWDEHADHALRRHFQTWFWSANPEADATLIYDPATSILDRHGS